MTEAEAALLRAARSGAVITVAMTVAAITDREVMDGFEGELKRQGALNGDAITAINDRRKELGLKR